MPRLTKLKSQFFNPNMIGKYLDAKTYKVLNRYGGTVRKTAQYSMRVKKGKSAEGTPPHAHDKKLLRKLLFYVLDKDSKSVVIGPVLKNTTKHVMIPKVHEFGGTITGRTKKGLQKTSHYPKRPYMKPAQDAHVGKVTQWYKDV